MGKKISGKEGPVIGISSSLELFEKLKYDSSRLEDGWHPYDAFNFLVTAYHLFEDWPQSDDTKALSKQKRYRKKLPTEMNLLLDALRDLVNGNKHFQLDPNSASKRRVDEVHTGNEVGAFEYFFHEQIPAITVDQSFYFSVRSLNNLVMRYFEWVFDDSIAVRNFPEELLESILYCNIVDRKKTKPTELSQKGIETAWNKNQQNSA